MNNIDGFELTDKTFKQYALNNYKFSHIASVDEFECDLRKIRHIVKTINKSDNFDKLVMLNNIKIAFNTFEYESVINMLKLKIEKEKLNILIQLIGE